MSNLKLLIVVVILLVIGFGYTTLSHHTVSVPTTKKTVRTIVPTSTPLSKNPSPLAIVTMREKSYPGSSLKIVQTLSSGTNYKRFIASYQSDGLTIYGLLTVPIGQKPKNGWPVMLFNHGYIPPASYSTATSYAVMIDPLASAGYIVFAPDYRGNDNSQGTPSQPYITPDYVTDSMNALASVKKYNDANPNAIGVFGHSMGGNITLHELVMTHDFKAAELMAGVVCNATDLLQWWNQRIANHTITGNDLTTSYIVEQMVKAHGTPSTNPTYWNALDPTQSISFINNPVQIQVGTADTEVPVACSTSLTTALQKAGKNVSLKEYQGADHNLVPDTSSAMAETVKFFNTYLK